VRRPLFCHPAYDYGTELAAGHRGGKASEFFMQLCFEHQLFQPGETRGEKIFCTQTYFGRCATANNVHST